MVITRPIDRDRTLASRTIGEGERAELAGWLEEEDSEELEQSGRNGREGNRFRSLILLGRFGEAVLLGPAYQGSRSLNRARGGADFAWNELNNTRRGYRLGFVLELSRRSHWSVDWWSCQ